MLVVSADEHRFHHESRAHADFFVHLIAREDLACSRQMRQRVIDLSSPQKEVANVHLCARRFHLAAVIVEVADSLGEVNVRGREVSELEEALRDVVMDRGERIDVICRARDLDEWLQHCMCFLVLRAPVKQHRLGQPAVEHALAVPVVGEDFQTLLQQSERVIPLLQMLQDDRLHQPHDGAVVRHRRERREQRLRALDGLERLGVAAHVRQRLRAVLPRVGANLRGHDRGIVVGRQRLRDRRGEIRHRQRIRRVLLQRRGHLARQAFERAAVAHLGVRRDLRPFLARRVMQQARDHVARLSLAQELARGRRELGQPRRIGLPLRAIERQDSVFFVVAHWSCFPFAPYVVSARRRHFETSFCAYFGFTPKWSAISCIVHPSK